MRIWVVNLCWEDHYGGIAGEDGLQFFVHKADADAFAAAANAEYDAAGIGADGWIVEEVELHEGPFMMRLLDEVQP